MKKAANVSNVALKSDEGVLFSDMNGMVDDGAKLVDNTLATMNSAKEKIAEELIDVNDEVEQEMAKYGKIGKEKARELAKRVLNLINHAPDYAGIFVADTEDAREQLSDGLRRH